VVGQFDVRFVVEQAWQKEVGPAHYDAMNMKQAHRVLGKPSFARP
jgi:hypothetical protein